MSTLTVYADTNDGVLRNNSATWATVRDGGGTNDVVDTTSTSLNAGTINSGGVYYIYQLFFSFDTSSIGAGQSITGVTFSWFINGSPPSENFVIDCRVIDWGTSLTAGDFVSRSTASAAPSFGTTTITTGGGFTYKDFSGGGTTGVNATGATRVVVIPQQQINDTPPGAGKFDIDTGYMADQTGTANDPKLVVTYTPVVSATLAASLGALTASATATPTVNATLAAPCGGLSATATATPTVAATLAAPLGSLSATATATPTVEATLSAPLGSLVAGVTATPDVEATLAAPLGALTASATADVTSGGGPVTPTPVVAGRPGYHTNGVPVPPTNWPKPKKPKKERVVIKDASPVLVQADSIEELQLLLLDLI